jgi:hypothetical protein
MIEITNTRKHPVQLVVKSKGVLRDFRTLNIPAVGKGKNVVLIEDERATECIDRIRKLGWISVRHVNRPKNKGE